MEVIQEILYGNLPDNRGNFGIRPRGKLMITSQGTGLTTQPWKELYQAAISEPDLNKLPNAYPVLKPRW